MVLLLELGGGICPSPVPCCGNASAISIRFKHTLPQPYKLACFCGAPENGGSVANDFNALVGATTTIMNTYVDGTQPGLPNTSSVNYGAGCFAANAPWNTMSADGKTRAIIPLIGCPMGTTANSDAQNLAYLEAVAAGQHDDELANYINIYSKLGFMTQYWRHGVEMNLTSTSGFNSYVKNPGVWIAAFQRICTVQRARALSLGVTFKMIWNPGCCSGTPAGNATLTLYPGDHFVDLIGGDFYADSQWVYGGITQAEIVGNPTLLAAYYTNPAMNSLSAPTVDASGGVSLSVPALAAFAKSRGKPLALCEVGAGGDLPVDGAVFWTWLRATLDAAVASGVTIAFVSPWNNNSPKPYQFTGGQQPLACAAIKSLFGVGAPAVKPVAPPAVVVPPLAALHAASSVGTQLPAWPAIYDKHGTAWAITSNKQIKRNGVVVAESAEVVALVLAAAGLVQLNTGGEWWTQPAAGGPGVITTKPPGYTAA